MCECGRECEGEEVCEVTEMVRHYSQLVCSRWGDNLRVVKEYEGSARVSGGSASTSLPTLSEEGTRWNCWRRELGT